MDKFGVRQALHDYYTGEAVALWVAVGGALLLTGGLALLLIRSRPGFRRGLGAASSVGGSLVGLGALLYLLSLPGQAEAARAALERDPVAWREDQLTHFEGVQRRLAWMRRLDMGLALAGGLVALGAFGARRRPGWRGAGLGVAAQAAVLCWLEGESAQRVELYHRALVAFDARPIRSQNPDDFRELSSFYERLRLAVRDDERSLVARMITYPLQIGDLTLQGQGDLFHHYDDVFVPELRHAIELGRRDDLDPASPPPADTLARGGLVLLRRCEGQPPACTVRVTAISTRRR